MSEREAMTLLAAANPVRVQALPHVDLSPDSILGRHRRPTRRSVLVAAVVAVAASAPLVGVFALVGHSHRSNPGMVAGLPGPTVAQPLPSGKRVSLAAASAAIGPALVVPDTSVLASSDTGPVWLFSNLDSVIAAVTFPRQGVFVEYSWPAAYSDPQAGYRSLVQDNGPNFHLIDLNGDPALAIDQNSDDTGQNFGVVAFTAGSTEVAVYGHDDQSTLASMAASILDRMPASARAAGGREGLSLNDVPIALHAPAIPPDTSVVQPSEAAPLAATDCPTGPHTSNPTCQVTIDFPSQGLTVRYSRPLPADPTASYRAVEHANRHARIVSLGGVPGLFVTGPTNSIEVVAGRTVVTVRGSYDERTLQAIARSILDRSRS
jgi:hypothetical protein